MSDNDRTTGSVLSSSLELLVTFPSHGTLTTRSLPSSPMDTSNGRSYLGRLSFRLTSSVSHPPPSSHTRT